MAIDRARTSVLPSLGQSFFVQGNSAEGVVTAVDSSPRSESAPGCKVSSRGMRNSNAQIKATMTESRTVCVARCRGNTG